ncbi:MAG: hypothetical protein RLZ55_1430 [Actinomycetota bacterium]|jgi:hypothetical protein
MSAQSLPRTPGIHQEIEGFTAEVELPVDFRDVPTTVARSNLFEEMMFR